MATKRLLGDVAVVTGVAHGIGRAIAVELAREGASVWACDVLERELGETRRAAAERSEAAVRAAVVDVTDAARVAAFVAEITAAEGRIDVLVNTAGGVAGQTMRPLESVSDEDWRRIFAINLDGAFHFTRAVAPAMKARRRGSVVNISSGAGRSYSLTGIQAYASAKHGQVGLVKQLAQELGPFGITVNSVAPGFMATSPDYQRQWNSYSEEFRRSFLERIAMRRMGKPEDIADAVLFFASDYASWITGQTLPVTGSPLA